VVVLRVPVFFLIVFQVVKWHLMLAKPIPSHEPTIISNKEGEEGEQSSAEKC
jgi:hypothetical protein